MRPFASTLLGAVELSPLEVAQMYQTIASGGFRSPLRAIREVTTQEGRPLTRYPLAVEQVFAPEPIYLLAAAMQGVVREGTAQGLKQVPAAPTSRSRARPAPRTSSATPGSPASPATASAIVWVGYDDNRAARLSGSAAALPIWGDMMAALAPEPLALAKPERIELSGSTRRAGCAADELPRRHRGAFRAGLGAARAGAVLRRHGCRGRGRRQTVEKAKSWLERLFGR